MHLFFLKILLFSFLQVIFQVNSCDIDSCGSNGFCLNEKCVCNEGFSGEKCQHCEGRFIITNDNGTFHNSDSESHLSNCFGFIKPDNISENETLHLSFPDILSSCACEYLNVYDGDSIHSPLLATFQGDVLPSQVTEVISSTGTVTLQFPNNENFYHDQGYKINYWVEPNNLDMDIKSNRNGSWESYAWPILLNKGRASTAMVLVEKKLFVFGGQMFGFIESGDIFLSLNVSSLEWEPVIVNKASTKPSLKHDHTMVYYNNTLLVFGGMNPIHEITNELWEFNINQSEWKEIKTSENVTIQPPPLIGHSAHVITKNGRDLMLVFFGYHRKWKINPFVFEYNLETQEWSKLNTTGAIPKATYGHGSVLDDKNNVVYLHGGLNNELKSSLYLFDVKTSTWTVLMSSPENRYLHSMSLLNENLVIYGGNVQRSNVESCEPCNVISTLSYNIECSEWSEIKQDLLIASSRYGQSAVQLNSTSMLIYGGYDSTMNNDIILYTLPEPTTECLNRNESECFNQTECIWDGSNCTEQICKQNTTLTCDEICKSSTGSCHNCLSTECSCCVDDSTDTCYYNNSFCGNNSITTCDDNGVEYCNQFQDCFTCFESGCNWDYQNHWCDLTKNRTDWTCPSTCLDFTNCHDCVVKSCEQCDCEWCETTQTCQPIVNQKAFDSYNTCPYFVKQEDQCTDDPCSKFESCDSCYQDDRCGWCDLGSNTGFGSCSVGNDQGPLNASLCPSSEMWHFMKCPECQCNGHSTCEEDEPAVCSNCTEGTSGEFCQFCDQLYYGDAINGNNCTECECNDHALECSKTAGICNCFVKGIIGKNCDQCSNTLGYFGDAENDTCYYNINVMTKYSFLLTPSPDEKVSQINFDSCPIRESSIEVNIQTNSPIDLVIAVNSTNSNETVVTIIYNTTYVVYMLDESDFAFGNKQSCVRIYVTDLGQTSSFVIWLYQSGPSIGLIVAIFLLCFLTLLIIAGIVWRINIVCVRRRRIRQVIIEREVRAARPFMTIHFEYSKDDEEDTIDLMQQAVSIISEETCSNGTASVYSTLLLLPGDHLVQSTLAIGSCLASSPDHKIKQNTKQNGDESNSTKSNLINNVFSHVPFRRRNQSGGFDNPVFHMGN